jgi:CelD/BcsL family acetyltransferase involved in cellulose biosynthesis
MPEFGSDPDLSIEAVQDLEPLRADWSALAERGGNIFGTWEWCQAWRQHIAPTAETAVAVVRRGDGPPLAILPLYVARQSPLRIVRFLGAGPSDELGPLCAPGDRLLAARALARHVDTTLGGRGVFVGELLPRQRGFDSALQSRTLTHASSPLIRRQGRSFDDYLADKSRNFREQVRRRERRLAREHQLVFRLCDQRERVPKDMATLFRLHRARWTRGVSTAFTGPRMAFHLAFAQLAFEMGWLRLWILELNGQASAAWYGFRFGGIESYYQAGRDPTLDRLGVGFVLLCHTIRAAFEDQVCAYSFGLGDETYKWRFAEDDPGLKTVVLARGVLGDAGLVAMSLDLRLRSSRRALALVRGLRQLTRSH